MTKAAPFTKASLRRAISVVREQGLHVVGIKADGTLLLSEVENPNPDVSLVPADRQDADDRKWRDE